MDSTPAIDGFLNAGSEALIQPDFDRRILSWLPAARLVDGGIGHDTGKCPEIEQDHGCNHQAVSRHVVLPPMIAEETGRTLDAR
jgi:hypothetical protein